MWQVRDEIQSTEVMAQLLVRYASRHSSRARGVARRF
jgi:hypothetical protein